MTKKREPFLIDLMDDTDSDSAGAPKPKAWKRLRKGTVFQETVAQVFDDPFQFHDFESPNGDPFAFGGIDWCGFTPDADELRWQARVREEKLDEGAIAYFQEEEEERFIVQKFSDSLNTKRENPIPDMIQVSRSSSITAGHTIMTIPLPPVMI